MRASPRDYDVVVIGGGAAGLAAARNAARRRASTLLVQDGPIGGECTFTGCVPSKALIAAAARGDSFDGAMARVHRAVATIAAWESDGVLQQEGVAVVHGRASFRSPREIRVDGQQVRARHIILAMGAAPVVPSIEGLQQIEVLTNENVFDLTRMPARLAVIGGGSIGCELAQSFRRLGSRVTIIEALDRLLSGEEPETSAVIAGVFRAEGIDIHLGRRVERVDLSAASAARLHLSNADWVEVDRVLVAVGRRPNSWDVGLEQVGVDTDEHGFVRTSPTMVTTAEGIWAAGDVTGRAQFTHAADEMARIAVSNALATGVARRRPPRFSDHRTPRVTFTRPEVGRVGMLEADAVRRGGRVAYLPMTEVDRAITEDDTAGFVKLVAGPRRFTGNAGGGLLLGATVVAARGGDMLQEAVLAVRAGLSPSRLTLAAHAYPTWSAAVQKAALQFFFEVEGRRAGPARHPHA